MTVLISVWPVLKSLPLIGTLLCRGEVAQRGDVDGEVRRAVGERHTFEDRRVRVQHRRGDRRVVGVDRRLERLEVGVRRTGLDEDLGARAPQHHDTVDLLLVAEAVDVFADRVEHRSLVDRVHRVVGVDALHVLAIERRRHRAHLAQRVADGLDVLAAIEHARPGCGDVGVVGERVPRPEHEIVERGQRHEVVDQRPAVVGALAEADRADLGQRTDWGTHAALDQLDTGDQRRGDGAEADGEHAETTVGRRDGGGRGNSHGREARNVERSTSPSGPPTGPLALILRLQVAHTASMPRSLLRVALMVAVVALAGCGSAGSSRQTPAETSASTTTSVAAETSTLDHDFDVHRRPPPRRRSRRQHRPPRARPPSSRSLRVGRISRRCPVRRFRRAAHRPGRERPHRLSSRTPIRFRTASITRPESTGRPLTRRSW